MKKNGKLTIKNTFVSKKLSVIEDEKNSNSNRPFILSKGKNQPDKNNNKYPLGKNSTIILNNKKNIKIENH